jgi:nitrogen fixation-related uncharacterized protein
VPPEHGGVLRLQFDDLDLVIHDVLLDAVRA